MEHEMCQVKVNTTEKGLICISQDDVGTDEFSVILIHPDQTDLLIEWIKEAKNELQG